MLKHIYMTPSARIIKRLISSAWKFSQNWKFPQETTAAKSSDDRNEMQQVLVLASVITNPHISIRQRDYRMYST